MLTSYLVSCPHEGCKWFGSLLPLSTAEAWHGTAPIPGVVVFQCPQCHSEWRARIVGDDVKPLPPDQVGAMLSRPEADWKN
jgi:hypothetical protein